MTGKRGRPPKNPRSGKCLGCGADLVDDECTFCGDQPDSDEEEMPFDLVEQMGFNL